MMGIDTLYTNVYFCLTTHLISCEKPLIICYLYWLRGNTCYASLGYKVKLDVTTRLLVHEPALDCSLLKWSSLQQMISYEVPKLWSEQNVRRELNLPLGALVDPPCSLMICFQKVHINIETRALCNKDQLKPILSLKPIPSSPTVAHV